MNQRKLSTRTLLPLLLFAIAALPACGDDTEDFVDVQGIYGDMRAISYHEPFKRVVCDATMASAPCTELKALKLVDGTDNFFRGIALKYTPGMITANTAYQSGILQPVTVYAVRAVVDATTNAGSFLDSSIEGGQITFTQLAQNPGDITSGTFSNMVLQRTDMNGVSTTLLTINQASFQYLQP